MKKYFVPIILSFFCFIFISCQSTNENPDLPFNLEKLKEINKARKSKLTDSTKRHTFVEPTAKADNRTLKELAKETRSIVALKEFSIPHRTNSNKDIGDRAREYYKRKGLYSQKVLNQLLIEQYRHNLISGYVKVESDNWMSNKEYVDFINKNKQVTKITVSDFQIGKTSKIDSKSDFITTISIDSEIKRTKGRVDLTFSFNGDKNPSRRIHLIIQLLGASGKTLASQSIVCVDARLRPDTIRHGSSIVTIDKINIERFEFAAETLRQTNKIELRLQNTSISKLRHIPNRPVDYGLTVTEPDKGIIRVRFTNPDGWNLKEGVHAFVLQLNVKDANGKLVDKVIEFNDIKILKKDEKYWFTLPIDKKYYDYSDFWVTFYTKQANNDKFLRDFFIEGKGCSYRGIWTSTGGELWRLPLEE